MDEQIDWTGEPVPDDVPAAEPMAPRESRYLKAGDKVFLPNEHLIIPDETCDEIGLRALADILDDLDMPGQHPGGMTGVEAKVIKQGRVVYTRGALWVYDVECHVWVRIDHSVLLNRVANYRQVQYGKPKIERKIKWVKGDDGEGREEEYELKTYKKLHMTMTKAANAAKMAETLVARDRFFEDAPVGLNFQDCFMALDADRKWRVYEEQRQEHRQRYIYPFSSPRAQCMDWPVDDERWAEVCPVLWRVLNSSMPGQVDDWRAIRMRFGLALAGLSQHVRGAHLWLTGPRGCGKSSLASAFGSLFPAETRTGVALHDASEYRTGALERSRVNIVGECGAIPARAADFFKDSLTAGEHGTIEVRDVGEKAMQIKPRFFQIYCSNGAPTMPPKEAQNFLNRFTVVTLRPFKGAADTTIGRQMEEQSRSLLTWAFAGFFDWQQNGLIESMESKLTKARWWRSTDNVLLWAASELVFKADADGVPVTQPAMRSGAFEHYLDWCERSNIQPRNRRTLQEFRSSLSDLELDVRRHGSYAISWIHGASLRERRPVAQTRQKM